MKTARQKARRQLSSKILAQRQPLINPILEETCLQDKSYSLFIIMLLDCRIYKKIENSYGFFSSRSDT
jgi:hypothetical protein